MGHNFLQVTLRDKMTTEKVAYFKNHFCIKDMEEGCTKTKTIPLCKYGNKLELLLLLFPKLC